MSKIKICVFGSSYFLPSYSGTCDTPHLERHVTSRLLRGNTCYIFNTLMTKISYLRIDVLSNEELENV